MITGIFVPFSVLAIVAGGMLSAFTARTPSRLTAWLSAYLVLVVGIVQLGLLASWRQLGSPEGVSAGAAFTLYNAGNLGVILGTVRKAKIRRLPLVVASGGLLIGIAMIMLLWAVRNARYSWALAGCVLLALIILISMPVGIVLSARRHNALKVASGPSGQPPASGL